MTEKKEPFVDQLQKESYNFSLLFSNLIRENKFWKRTVVVMCSVVMILTGTLVYVSQKATYIPYLIFGDLATGHFSGKGLLIETKMEIPDNMKEYFLRQLFTRLRSVPKDEVILDSNLKQSSAFFTRDAYNQYLTLGYEKEIYDKFQKQELTTIEIISIQKMPTGENLYQIRWLEKEIKPLTKTKVEKSLIGTVNLIQETPSNEMIEVNPLGLLISDFTITVERK